MHSLTLGVAGLLLVIAGAGKVVDPSRTAGALAALGWPSSGQIVRLGAALELMLGVATLVVGGKVLAMLVAASYLGFSMFVMTALRLGKPIATCGCFAQADTPPSPVHVAVTSALALGAVVSASIGSDPLVESGWLTWVGAAALTAVVLALLTRRSA